MIQPVKCIRFLKCFFCTIFNRFRYQSNTKNSPMRKITSIWAGQSGFLEAPLVCKRMGSLKMRVFGIHLLFYRNAYTQHAAHSNAKNWGSPHLTMARFKWKSRIQKYETFTKMLCPMNDKSSHNIWTKFGNFCNSSIQ